MKLPPTPRLRRTSRRKRVVFRAMAVLAIVLVIIVLSFMPARDPREAKARRLVADLCWHVDEEPPTLWDRMLAKLGLTGSVSDLNLDQIRSELAGLGEPAVPPLVEALQEGNSKVRVNIISVLADMGPAATKAVPALIEALTYYSSEEVYWYHAWGKGGDLTTVYKEATDALLGSSLRRTRFLRG